MPRPPAKAEGASLPPLPGCRGAPQAPAGGPAESGWEDDPFAGVRGAVPTQPFPSQPGARQWKEGKTSSKEGAEICAPEDVP